MLPRQLGSVFGSVLDVGAVEPQASLDVDGRADEDTTGPGCATAYVKSLSDHALWQMEMRKIYRACPRRCDTVAEEDYGPGSSLDRVSYCGSKTRRQWLYVGTSVACLRDATLHAILAAVQLSIDVPINLFRQMLLPCVQDAKGRCVAPIPAL